MAVEEDLPSIRPTDGTEHRLFLIPSIPSPSPLFSCIIDTLLIIDAVVIYSSLSLIINNDRIQIAVRLLID